MIRLRKEEALARLADEATRSAAFGGCTMCRLASERDETRTLAENESGIAVLDNYGSTEAHVLIISKSHLESVAQIPWSPYEQLQRLVWQANRVLTAVMKPRRIYTAALGASETLPMTFPHYHVHVIPIYQTGADARPARIFSWSSGVVCYDDPYAAELCQRLRSEWRSLPQT